MCECYKIGGPFIAEDPECPEHGREAQEREHEEQEAKVKLLEEINSVASFFLEKELRATDEGVRRYYSGMAEGLRLAYKIVQGETTLDEVCDG